MQVYMKKRQRICTCLLSQAGTKLCLHRDIVGKYLYLFCIKLFTYSFTVEFLRSRLDSVPVLYAFMPSTRKMKSRFKRMGHVHLF